MASKAAVGGSSLFFKIERNVEENNNSFVENFIV